MEEVITDIFHNAGNSILCFILGLILGLLIYWYYARKKIAKAESEKRKMGSLYEEINFMMLALQKELHDLKQKNENEKI